MKHIGIKQQRNPIPGGILLGTAAAMLWSITISVIVAWLIHSQRMDLNNVGWSAMGIHLVGGWIAGYTAWLKAKQSRLAVSLSAAGGYFLTLLGITALFFGGIYTGMGVTALLILMGAGISVVPALAGQGRRRRAHYKIFAS